VTGVGTPSGRDGRNASDEQFLAAARRYWHPVARSRDLDPGQVVGVTLLAEELALWRDRDGTVALLEDLCVHRGTRLSTGQVGDDDCLRCPYHGWEFDAQGRCTRIPQLPDVPIPARARVCAYRVREHAGLIWTCLAAPGEEARSCPHFAGIERRGVRIYAGEPKDWDCQSPRQIENFCDIAHFSIVHIDAFGNPDVTEIEPFTVERSDFQLRWEYTYPARDPMAAMLGGIATAVKPIHMEYCIELPFTASLTSSDADQHGVLLAANQPVTATTSRLFWVYALDAAIDVPDEVLEAGQDVVMSADRDIVSGQRPERLPLDLAAELHLPFDRQAVAYRRALTELGFPASFGTGSAA
jgi:phenylpropionate dioxygenase-like ring-hydroxylating dioxygenase large terminal subunit